MHTSRACGFNRLNLAHSRIVAVPRPAFASTHDSLSEMKMTRSPFAWRLFSKASGAEQFVPPPPIAASFCAFVITESRAFNVTLATSDSNGSTSACRFWRRIEAATNAATSIQRTVEVAPGR